jgi:anti-anti-sigma regulatory factor
MRLNIEEKTVGATVVVRITGVVDWSTLAQFRRKLRALVSRPDPHVRLDVRGVIFWSPEARVVLQRYIARARLRGGEIAVSGLSSLPRWEVDADLPSRRARVQRRGHQYPRASHLGTYGGVVAPPGHLRLVRPAAEVRRSPGDEANT